MGALRYVSVIVLVGALALATVSEHVERTRLGYELRKLEQERVRLVERRKAARLAYERAVVPEHLRERAAALGVASEAELKAGFAPTGVQAPATAVAARSQSPESRRRRAGQ
ncbi:MAG: hypothetical protein AB7N76_01355 [Planctomycetota bacterium]